MCPVHEANRTKFAVNELLRDQIAQMHAFSQVSFQLSQPFIQTRAMTPIRKPSRQVSMKLNSHKEGRSWMNGTWAIVYIPINFTTSSSGGETVAPTII
jgi:hypothetical protein